MGGGGEGSGVRDIDMMGKLFFQYGEEGRSQGRK
jgi:hypothetical protein